MTGAAEESGHPWLPAPPCTVRTCLPRSAPRVGPARRTGRWAALAVVFTAGVLLAPFVRGRPTAGTAARLWTRALVRAVGVRLRVVGGRRPVAGPALVVANHVSWLDVPLLAAVRPGRMLAKAEVAGYPVFGRLAAYGGTVFIDRERLRALPGTVASLTGLLRAGSAVVAFPEGSTWCGRGRGGPFRHAVFQAAIDADVPVQPLAVRYRRRGAAGDPAGTTVAAFVGEDTLLASLRRVIAARGVVAEVTVLPPIPPGSLGSRAALAGAAGRAIATAGNLPIPGPHRRPGEGEGEVRRWRRTGTNRSTVRRLFRPTRGTPVQEAPQGTVPALRPRVPAQRRPSP